ncbi:hypothetical protein PYW07_000215 [Mythimna separata]|uniref:C3H1-type domain-containing protein n=1 Tax=Mythimna separata TaxID=271217 RepID=A0AAD8E0V3_MYTSE|nr:hypothetical protein PYW07_000215 [Mythimna separata]
MILQVKEMEAAEEENLARFRSDEDSINFRPSPNFKHMKKYLKVHKLDEAMSETNSSSSEENTALLVQNKPEKVNKVSSTAQPPLPPNPPPPDTPTSTVHDMIVTVKQEIDDEYISSTAEMSPGLEHTDKLKATAATIKVDHTEEKPGVTMCRNFARGTCKKGTACIFAHQLILSQLPGVYTFCRNFQNSVCSFPKCKFVHATVFEKEHFFRTGYLPPHALAHLKEATVQQAPPPLPQPEEGPAVLPPVYSGAVPGPSIPCVPPALVQYGAESVAEPEGPNIFNPIPTVTSTVTSPKRVWSEIDEVNSSTGALDSGEPLAKKCKTCDSNELREQMMRAKIENMIRVNKEIAQKIASLKKKNALRAALFRVFLTGDGSNGDKENLSNNTSEWSSVLEMMLRRMKSGMPPDSTS